MQDSITKGLVLILAFLSAVNGYSLKCGLEFSLKQQQEINELKNQIAQLNTKINTNK